MKQLITMGTTDDRSRFSAWESNSEKSYQYIDAIERRLNGQMQ